MRSNWHSWTRLIRKSRAPYTKHPVRRSVRLTLEALEDRVVPCVTLDLNEIETLEKLGIPVPPNLCATSAMPLAMSASISPTPTNTSPTVSGKLTGGDGNMLTASVDGGPGFNVTLNADGTFSFPVPIDGLADGSHTVKLTATDTINEVVTKTLSFFLDTKPPVVTITSPGENADLKTVTVTGTVTDPTPSSGLGTLKASVDGGTQTTVTVTSGKFTFTPSGLSNGSHTITFIETDKAGNQSSPTSITFTIDTQAPTITVTDPANNGFTNHDIKGTFGDNFDNVTTITATVDGHASSTTVVFTPGMSGNFSFPVAGLSNGSHTISFTATDQAGNTGTTGTISFTLDTDANLGLTVNQPTTPSNTTPTITGSFNDTIDQVTSITATVNGSPGGSATFTPGKTGNFTYTPTLNGDGTYTVTFTATDQAGNSQTTSVTFVFDTTAPTLQVTSPANNAVVVANPNIQGTFSDALDNVTSITVKVDGASAGSATFTAAKNGTFSFLTTFKTDGSQDGSHTVVFTGTDQAGNSSTASVTFTLATQGPIITITSPTPGIVTNTNITIDGTVMDAATITSFTASVDGGTANSVTLTSGGFQFPTTLATNGSADGPHVVTFQAQDNAGHTSTVTFNFTLDTSSNLGLVINPPPAFTNTVPTITGSFNDSVDKVTTITAKVDGGSAVAVTTTPALPAQSGTLSFNPGSLADGLHTVAFTATDQAGNSQSQTVSFTLDTSNNLGLTINPPPAFTNTVPTITGSFNDTEDKVTSITAKVDNGTATPVTATPTLPAASGTLSFNPGSLADGLHTVIFTATDQAGNSQSQTVTFTLDTNSNLGLAINAPPAFTNTVPTITGSFNDTEDKVTTITAKVDNGAAVSVTTAPTLPAGAGTLSFNPGTLADGLHTVAFTATDQAGNSQTQTVSFTLDTSSNLGLVVNPPPSFTNTVPTITGSFNDTEDEVVTLTASVDAGPASAVTTTPALPVGSGTFSFAPGSLADGLHTVTFTATDQAGNSQSKTVSFTLDTNANLGLSVNAPPSFTNSTPTLTGSFNDTEDKVMTLTASVDGGTAVAVTTTPALPIGNGTFSFQPSGLADGLHTVVFTATDQAGNSQSKSVSFTLDTQPPVLTFTSPVNGAAFSTSPTIQGNFTDGTDSVTSITVTVNGSAGGPVTFTPGPNGTFSFNPNLALNGTADGPYTLVFTGTDQAGNSGTATFNFTLNTKTPVITITGPPLNFFANTNITITGIVTDGASGNITSFTASVDGGPANTVTNFNPGTGAFQLPTTFPTNGSADGPHTVVFSATDNAGNTGTFTYTFTLDTQAPTLTVNPPPSITNTNPTITGSFGDLSDKISSLTATIDGNPLTVTTSPVLPTANGTLSFTTNLALDGSKDGPHTVAVTATDQAGNMVSRTVTFTLDTKPPVLTVTAPPAFTNTVPTITGTFSDALDTVTTITATVDGNPGGPVTFTPAQNGSFSFNPGSLANGPHTIAFTATDQVGNTSPPSSVTFTLDTSANLGLVINPPPAFTNTVPVITGSFNDTEDKVVSITAKVDNGSAVAVTTTPTLPAASGTLSFTPGSLADGLHTVLFTATDQAGNSQTQVVSFTLDTSNNLGLVINPPPAFTNTVPTITGSFNDTEDKVTTITAQVDNGSAVPVTTVPVLPVASGTLSFNPGSLADGLHTVTFTATDQAGNSQTQSVSFTLDTNSNLGLVINPPPAFTNTVPAITGSFNDTEDKVTTITAKVDNGAAVAVTTVPVLPAASGTLSFNPGTLADGLHTVVFTATDQAGNSQSQMVSFTLDTSNNLGLVINPPPSFTNAVPTITGSFNDTEDKVTTITAKVDNGSAVAVTTNPTLPAASGTLSFNPGSLADGLHTVVFTATDQAGNSQSQTVTFTLDTNSNLGLSINPPPAFTNTVPAITGSFNDTEDKVTTITAKVDNGTAMPVTTVPVLPAASGTLSFTPGSLADGLHTVVFTATDQAGNSQSQTVTFTLDTNSNLGLAINPPPAFTNTVPTITGSFNDTEDKVTTLTAKVDNGTAVAVTTTPVLPVASGTLSFNPGTLADGLHTVTFTATDQAGNSQTQAVSFTLDTSNNLGLFINPPPAFTNTVPTITGSFNDTEDKVTTITAQVDGGSAVPVSTVPSLPAASGTLSFTSGSLADGLHTVVFTATDQAGNSQTQSVSFTLDTNANLGLVVNQPTTPTKTIPTITGSFNDTEDKVATLTAKVDGGSAVAVTATPSLPVASGTFSFTPGSLADGAHTVVFTATDQAGNSQSKSVSFTLDTQPPVLTFTSPVNGAAFATSPTIQGNFTDANDSVTSITVTVNGNAGGPVTFTPGPNGTFSFNPNLALNGSADGPYVLVFTGTDQVGNVGTATFNFTLNTKIPVITITAPPLNFFANTNITITGTVTDGANGTITSFTASVDGGPANPVTNFNPSTGAFQLPTTFPTNGSADGPHTVLFSATDNAGNTGTFTYTFTLDTQAPTLSVNPPPSITNTNPTITGSFGDLSDKIASLTATIDGNPLTVTTSPVLPTANGTFSFTTNLALDGSKDGPHTVAVTATDQAGNTISRTVTFTLDTKPPALTVTAPPAFTNTVPTITGTFSDALDTVTTITATVDGNPGGPVTFTPAQNGSFSFNPGSLADGPHTIAFTATDQVGNTSPPSPVTFTLDTSSNLGLLINPPPAFTNTVPTITGSFNDTEDKVVSITAKVDNGSAVAVTTTPALPAASGTLSFTPGSLADGLHTVLFTATDQAGNSQTQVVSFTLDTSNNLGLVVNPPPAFTNTVPTITGSFNDTEDKVATITAKVDNGAAVPVSTVPTLPAAAGNLSFTPTGLADGLHTITFTATDQAGNSQSQTVSFTLDTSNNLGLVINPPPAFTNTVPTITGSFNDTVDKVTTLTAKVDNGAAVPVTTVPVLPAQTGTLSFAPGSLADGLHTISFTATDQAGNSQTQTVSFTLDTSNNLGLVVNPPPAFTNTVPTITGSFNDTEDKVATLTAKVDNGAAVAVTTVPALPAASGTLSFNAGSLADGFHTVVFTATDQAGNSQSQTVSFTLDTNSNLGLVINPPPAFTNAVPTLTGSFNDTEDKVVSITAKVDNGTATAVTTTPTLPAAAGTLSFNPGSLADGLHTITFTATDQAGNGQTQSVSFTLDTLSNLGLIINPPPAFTNAVPTITGSFNDTEDKVTSLTAKVDNGAAVSVSTVPVLPAANGTLSFNPGSLADGLHTVTFTAEDQAGNSQTQSVSFTLDTNSNLGLMINPPPAFTNSVPTITGSFNDTEDKVASLTARVDGGTAVNVATVPTLPTASGNLSFNPGSLADGSHTVTFTATDQAGNSQTQSVSFTLVTAQPTLTVQQPTSPTNTNQTITGSFSATGDLIVSLTASVDGKPAVPVTTTPALPAVSGNLSFTTTFALDGTDDGNHTITFTAVDQAGNSVSQSVSFLLDTQGPIITFDPPFYNNTNPTFTGNIHEPLTGVASFQASVDGGPLVNVIVTPSLPLPPNVTGSFSFQTNLPLDGSADGNHSVKFFAKDPLGNTSSETIPFFLDTRLPVINVSSSFPSGGTTSQSPTITGTISDPNIPTPFTPPNTSSSGLNTLFVQVNGGALTPVTFTPTSVDPSTGRVLSATFSFNPNLAGNGSADGQYDLDFTVADNATNSTTVGFQFALDAGGPQITVSNPTQGEVISTSPVVTGHVNDPGSTVTSVTIVLDNGPPVTVPLDPNGNFTYPTNLPVNGTADGPHTITVTATDTFGKTNMTSVSFTLATVKSVISLSPQINIITSDAFAPTTGKLYVANYSTIYRIDAVHGTILNSFPMPGGGSNAMQILPTAITLGTTSVPAGSLLVYNSAGAPDQIYALDPTTGQVLAKLAVPADPNDGVGIAYNPTNNIIYLLLSGNNVVVGINPTTGAMVSTFATPTSIGYGALAVDPTNGDLWIGSIYTNTVYQVNPTTGAVLQQVDLSGQGPEWNVTGLAFVGGSTGNLIAEVSVVSGIVYKVTI